MSVWLSTRTVLERGNSERRGRVVERAKKKEGRSRGSSTSVGSPLRKGPPTRRGKKSRQTGKRDGPWRDSPRYEEAAEAEAEVEAEAEAEAAAVAAAVPGHQGTVTMAQAPLDVPGAGCATKRGRERERERRDERGREYRRVPVGSLSAASRGTERGAGDAQGVKARRGGEGGWRRHERTPYSEGFQAAVYGPGQRDQDQPRAREGEREPSSRGAFSRRVLWRARW